MGTKRKETDDAIDKAREAANAFLQPVIDGTRDIFGSRIKLAELLSVAAGKPVSRHLIIRWLKDDPTKRQQPLLRMGLLLREVFDANQKIICEPWDSAERRKPRLAKKRTNKKEPNAEKIT